MLLIAILLILIVTLKILRKILLNLIMLLKIYGIDIVNTYTIESSKVTLFEYIIEGIFITNSVLEISCNILYKYANYNDVGKKN